MSGWWLGLLGGLGAALVVSAVPWWRGPRLVDRVAPYLLGAAPGSRLLEPPGSAVGVVRNLLTPLSWQLAGVLERLVGANASVARRLQALGGGLSPARFRQQQAVAVLAGMGLGMALFALRAATGVGLPPVSLLGSIVLLGGAGFVGRDRLLSRAVRRRNAALLADLPASAELLALAVSAGESPLGALERLCRVTSGPMAQELRRTLADTRAGDPLEQALAALAERTWVPAVRRFAEGIAVALHRGTPLADVVRAQAADAREAGRRALLEAGGRKDIAMLLPVVFLILPVTVLFALFPGAVALTTLTR